jgi:hypothetical protein
MNDSRIVTLEDLSRGWNAYSGIQVPMVRQHNHQAIYDIQGRRLPEVPHQGIYIRNGKKIINH